MIDQSVIGQINDIFNRYNKPGSPGSVVAVGKDQEVFFKQGYGLANIELKSPNQPSTVFNIGSMAKQFTAFALALLEDEGKLSTDDDIRKYLPEMHDFESPITIQHLIHHTSGLRNTFPELLALAEWRDTDTTTTKDTLWLLESQRELNFLPGNEYQYSNSNYILLARICEQVSGMTFAEFSRKRIFDPLGMTRTTINDSIFKLIPERASGYYDGENGMWFNAPLSDSVVGPTNIYTTVEDLLKWDANFYTGQVGGLEVMDRIQKPGQLKDGTVLDYAFGLQVGPSHQYRGWQLVEHGGSQGGYSSWMMRYPELRLCVVVLFNHFMWDMREYALKVADLFLEDRDLSESPLTGPVPKKEEMDTIQLTKEQLEAKAGIYYNHQRAAMREVGFFNGRLQFQGLDLLPITENTFSFEVEPGTHVRFDSSDEGVVTKMTTITPSGDYGYKRVKVFTPSTADLKSFVGSYYSPELDIHWRIEAGDKNLIAKRRKYLDSFLTPVFEDGFSDDWTPIMGYPRKFLVVFQRDQDEHINGLSVSGDEVRNLHFKKV